MNKLRGILAGFFAGWLSTVVLLGLFLVAIGGVVTNKDTVKGWLANQHTYAQADSLIKQITNQNQGKKEVDISPLVKKIVDYNTYSSAISQSTDSVYAWLEGDTEKLRFKIKIADNSMAIKSKVSTALKQHMAELPRCKSVQDIQGFDPLTAKCRPALYKPATIDQFLANPSEAQGPLKELLNSGTLSSDTIKVDEQTKSSLRQGYSWLKAAPLYVGLAILILSGLVVLLSRDWRLGLRRVGTALAVPTGILILIAIILNNMDWAGRVADSFSGESAEAAQAVARTVVPSMVSSLTKSIGGYALGLFVIGLVLIGLSILLLRRGGNAPTANSTAPGFTG